jgi:glycosyltransferase involved in cell wall biosynthesis
MRPLRIVMTTDAVGGVWQYSLELAGALAGLGHRVTLAALGPAPSADQRAQAIGMAGVCLIETGLALDWLAGGADPVEQAGKAVAALIRSERADLFHCNMPTLAAAARFDVPVVAVTHGCVATWWEAARPELLAQEFHWHREMMRGGLAAADAVVAPSASYAETIRRMYDPPAQVSVVNNGRATVAGQGDGPLLAAALTIGRQWDPVKNACLLDTVAGELEVPFYAAGATRAPHGESVELANLHCLGQLDSAEVAGWLSRRPVFVSAATFEPFGLAVLEAAGAGCPLVLSDIPTFRELWDGAALFANPRDADTFQQAIALLLADPAKARSLGDAAAARAAGFTPAATAAGMEAIYHGVLARHRAAA